MTKKYLKKLDQRYFKAEKKRNIFLMVTIIFVVMILSFSALTVENIIKEKKTEVENLHQGIFYNVDKRDIEKLEKEKEIEKVGVYSQIKNNENEDYTLSIKYYNDTFWKIGDTLKGEIPREENEVIVTEGLLRHIGEDIGIGDEISLDTTDSQKYKITGIIQEKDTISSSPYPVFISEKYYENLLNDVIETDAYVWLKDRKNIDEEDTSELLETISKKNGIPEWSISSYFEYNNTTYSDLMGYAGITIIILLAAGVVIYTIFYISVGMKIKEYGQIRAIGATQKQIKYIVKQEGNIAAVRAIPFGLIIGGGLSWLVQPEGWGLASAVITIIGIVAISLIWIQVSVNVPAKTAAKVSVIESMKGMNYKYKSNKEKKKSINITPLSLAIINLKRNGKKTIISIMSLSICGILLLGGASYQSSFTAEGMARAWEFPYGNFKITNKVFYDDSEEMYSIAKSEIQNPLTNKLREQILNISGVEDIKTWYSTSQTFSVVGTDISERQENQILGYADSDVEKMQKSLISGTVNINELEKNRGIIVSDPKRVKEVYNWDVKIGDTVNLNFYNAEEKIVSKEFKVMGITESRDGFNGYIFRLPVDVLENTVKYSCVSSYEIITNSKDDILVAEELEKIIGSNDDLMLEKISDVIEENQTNNQMLFWLIYILVALLAVFAVVNCVNIHMTEYWVREKEIAIIQAIGMTEKQLFKSLVMEGLIIAGFSIIISTFVGSLLGIGIGYALKQAGMSVGFRYPLVVLMLYVFSILLLEFCLTLYSIKKSRKYTLVERIRRYE